LPLNQGAADRGQHRQAAGAGAKGEKAMKLATIEAYARPIVVAAGCLLLLLGVYKLAGWWGLVTALGAILLLFGALG